MFFQTGKWYETYSISWLNNFFEKKECQYTVFLCPLCTYPFSKVFMNMLTLECPLLHICLSLPKSPALQITLIHSSFKPVKPIFLNRYMSVPWKVWISESRWKYKRMLLKNVLISLNSYSSRQDLAKKKAKLSWKTCYFVDEEVQELILKNKSEYITGCTFPRSFSFYCCIDLTLGYSSKIFTKLSIKYWFECFKGTNYRGIYFRNFEIKMFGNSKMLNCKKFFSTNFIILISRVSCFLFFSAF